MEQQDGLAMRCGAATWLLRAALEARVNGDSEGRRSILVVDDEAATRGVFSVYLRRRGFDVIEAEHGQGALVVAQQTELDAIVLDIQMPVLDGVTTAELLKLDPSTAHIPLIAVTGYPFEGGEEEARRLGFAAYLPKPLAPDELARAITELLQAE